MEDVIRQYNEINLSENLKNVENIGIPKTAVIECLPGSATEKAFIEAGYKIQPVCSLGQDYLEDVLEIFNKLDEMAEQEKAGTSEYDNDKNIPDGYDEH